MSVRDILLAASQVQSQYPAWDIRSARPIYAPWIFTTARFYTGDSFLVSSQETFPTGLAFNSSGTKMYVVGQTNDTIYQYSLTTPWVVNTATYDGVSFSLSGLEATPTNMFFKPTGEELWIAGSTEDSIFKIVMSTPWDLSTATFSVTPFMGNLVLTGNNSSALTDYDTTPTGIVFHPDGDKLFYVGSGNDTVWAFSLSPDWDLSSIAPIETTWDIAGPFYTGQSFSVASQELTPQTLFFKNDGTEMYVLGQTNDTVYQYNLSTAWDVSTASYTTKSFSVASQETAPTALYFKDDGTTFFVVGTNADTVFEYTVATPWDVSTASYTGNSFSVNAQEANPTGIFFKPDGTKMYIVGTTGDDVNEYNLGTAWNITTASFSQTSATLTQDSTPRSLIFSDDGLKLFILGGTTDTLYQYALTVAWDVSTITYQGRRSRSLTQDSAPTGIYIKPDGKVLYLVGTTNDTVYQYNLYEAVFLGAQDTVPADIEFKPDGSKMYMVGSTGDKVYQYDLSTNWNLSTAIYSSIEFSLAPYELTPTGLAFSNDGDYMFITGNTVRGVIRFSLTTPWDLTTGTITFNPYDFRCRSSTGLFSVATQETAPNAVAFKTDGTIMYVIGSTGDDVNQYALSTAWDVTTASFTKVSSALTQDTVPTGLAFSSDGTKMFMCGSGTDAVYQYVLGTAWDVATISYTGVSFSFASQDTVPRNIWFSSDGLRMFMVGTTNDYVWQYDLSVAWDLSTVTFSPSPWNVRGSIYESKSFSVTSQESAPFGMFFSSNGDKMYVIGQTNNTVYQYSLTTPWDISTASYTSVSFASPAGTSSQTVVFKTDGTRMYIMGSTLDRVFSFDLASGWDLSTATFTPNPWIISSPFYQNKSFSVTSQEATPTGMIFGDSGTKMYIVGTTNDTVYQYTLNTAWDVSTASYASLSFSVGAQEATPQAVFFKADGTSMYILGQTNDTVYQYDLTTPWDVSSSSYTTKSFSIGGQETTPTGLYISPDGLNMYMTGSGNDAVYQYVLGTAWDISTASYTGFNFGVSALETVPTGIFFKDDGTILYVIGSTGDQVHSIPLGTPWSLNTANVSDPSILSFSVAAQDGTPQKVVFRDNGETFYILGGTNDTVYQYAVADGFSVAGQETTPTDVAFSSDGSLMYVVGSATDTVYQYSLSTPWKVSTAVYSSISVSVASIEAAPTGLDFSPDGLLLYIIGTGADRVHQIPLNVPWQVNSVSTTPAASSTIPSISLIPQDATVQKVRFKSNGETFYILGNTNDTIYQYSLVKTFNATVTNAEKLTGPAGLAISADGKRVFLAGIISGGVSSAIYVFTLKTAWDITTVDYQVTQIALTYIATSLQLGAITPTGLSLSADGNYLYLLDETNDRVTQYALLAGISSPTTGNNGLSISSDGKRVTFVSTTTDRAYGYELDVAWDLTTASRVVQSPSFTATEGVPSAVTYKSDGSLGYLVGTLDIIREALPVTTFYPVVTLDTNEAYQPTEPVLNGVFWKNDGTKFYLVGSTNDAVYQYSVSTPWNSTTATFEKSLVVSGQELTPSSVAFNKTGYEMYVLGQTGDVIDQYNLGTPWDIGTASYSNYALSVSSQETTPQALAFATTGKDLYITGSVSDSVHQYRFYASFSVSSQTLTPADITFSSDGTKMYVASATQSRNIYQYSLSSPWNVVTAAYEKVSGIMASIPNGIYIKSDGLTLFSVSNASDRVEEYAMSVAWDISTLSFTEKTFSVATQEITPFGIFFKPDGTKMYVMGTTGDDVNEYTLNVAWDITSASYVQVFSVSAQETLPTGLYFKPDGTKMYVSGQANDTVFEYVIATPWDISTASYTGNSFAFGAYETIPTGLEFKDDGTVMYVIGTAADTVFQFQLGG